MNRNKSLPILLLIGTIVIIGIIIWQVMGNGLSLSGKWKGVEGDPVDVTLNFYEAWMASSNSTSSDPISDGLLEYDQVGEAVAVMLSGYEGKLAEAEMDPVLCQSETPEGLRTLPVYKQEDSAQVLVMSTTKGQSGQAVVTLAAQKGLWQITDITCGNAETAPDREYSFDKSGFLLKQVPEPLDSNYWHLVFEEAGVLGHAVPLFIDGETVCVLQDGSSEVCSDSALKETMPAHVYGSMSEAGVDVKKIELVESVSIE